MPYAVEIGKQLIQSTAVEIFDHQATAFLMVLEQELSPMQLDNLYVRIANLEHLQIYTVLVNEIKFIYTQLGLRTVRKLASINDEDNARFLNALAGQEVVFMKDDHATSEI